MIPRSSQIDRLVAFLAERWAKRGIPGSSQLNLLKDSGPLAETVAACRTAFPEEGLDLVSLLLEARKPRPTMAWLKRWAALRDRLDRQRLRDLLLELAEAGNVTMRGWGPQAGDPIAFIARGALWALSDFRDDETRDYLVRTILGWSRSSVGSPALGSAAIWALARPAGEEATRRLLDLKGKVSHRNLQTRLEVAILSIATASGVPLDEMADRQVPDHGLDSHGERTWELQEYVVTLFITADGRAERKIVDPEGRARKSVPPRVRQSCSDAWSAIMREMKDLKATLSVQRARMEDAMIGGRSWTARSWNDTIASHPVLASIGRRLVWEIRLPADGERLYAMPVGDGWGDQCGDPVEMPEHALLSIAHPVSMSGEAQGSWQRRIVDRRMVQPFKQVFRESYVVSPVEAEAPYASTRFAGFPVPTGQIYALTRARGWSGTLGQTGFCGAGEGYREFPGYDIRAVLRHDLELPTLVAIETVHFDRNVAALGAKRKVWSAIPLRDVPPIPFSEAMRDVDLLVSVAAFSSEARWREWEAAGEAGRLREGSERSLAEMSKSTAALLQAMLPILGVEKQVEIRGHFAFVRGQRGAYRIHLLTGSILLEPSGRYLCIVPAPGRDRLYLPFEGDDRRISEIMSKIVLLARDSAIRDRSVLRQLATD